MTECWVLFLVLAVGLAQGIQDTLTPELSDLVSLADSQQQLWDRQGLQDADMQDLADKRSWDSFHGSWGKREGLNNFHGSWGKRDVQDTLLEELVKQARWNQLHGSQDKRAWSQFRGAWSKRSGNGGLQDEDSNLPGASVGLMDEAEGVPHPGGAVQQDSATGPVPHKRGWWSGSWFKRPQSRSLSPRSTNWSSLRGTWGKRSSNNNWSSLRGAWGKRGQDWSNFRGSWGKREEQHGDSSNVDKM